MSVALDRNRLSLALGTAIQFETAIRQKDVISEWEPVPDGQAATGIVLNGRRWTNGLLWSDLAADLVLRKATPKTGPFAAHDLTICPIVVALLNRVPRERRVGPVIIDATAGRPDAESAYGRERRIVVRAANVPDHVWPMDARAGANTEAEDAGAALDLNSVCRDTRAKLNNAAMFSRAIGKSRTVANLRGAHQAVKNGSSAGLEEHDGERGEHLTSDRPSKRPTLQ